MYSVIQKLRVFNQFSFIKNYFSEFGLRRPRSQMDTNLKCRDDPVVLILDSPEFKNIFTDEVKDLKKLFDKYQYEIRIAGGAVRDLLMGLQPKDLDFATTATPQEMKYMFTAENVRMINMNGEKHGTITPRINDKENFEVTTLRIDMITDGRHAEVQFTKDWKLDANRRDLTINSMFLGFDGSVYDYFFGYDDLKNRRVVFVGDADVRIKEDYLRILRYFRFYGRIAEKPDSHNKDLLKVISSNAVGLENISGERIWVDLKKTLQGNFPGPIMKTMISVGIGKYVGLPANPYIEEMNRVLHKAHLNLHPMTILASLLHNVDEVLILHNRLKFSKYERQLVYFIVEYRGVVEDLKRPMLPYEKLVLHSKIKHQDMWEYVQELLKYKGEEKLLKEFINWKVPKFPITGKVLKEMSVPSDIMYGVITKKLKDIWIDSEYKDTLENLVKHIPNIIEELEIQKKSAQEK